VEMTTDSFTISFAVIYYKYMQMHCVGLTTEN